LDQASNTLTPGRACRNYFNNVNSQGRSYGAAQLLAFGKTYLPAVSERLRKGNPDIVFSNEEVYSMQEMCGFETLVHGKSPWCDVFTRDEWDSFEYARDLQHYYRAGPGNPYGASLGFLWLNATTNLLQSGPAVAGPLFLSFNHDGDILTLLAALDLFPQESHLPTSHVQHDRAWRLSDVTPMHGRIALERMTCAIEKKCWSNPIYPNHVYCNEDSGQDRLETFVRIDVNDAIVPIPGCVSGPGGSCPLEEFAERVSKRGKELTSFNEMCGNGEDGEEGIKFLHQ
jgi:acid phosphatase